MLFRSLIEEASKVPCLASAVAAFSSEEHKHSDPIAIVTAIRKVKRTVKPETLQILSLWRDVCREKTNSSKVVRKTHPLYDEIKAEFDKRSKGDLSKQKLEVDADADEVPFALDP